MSGLPNYPAEPADKEAFTQHNDRMYGRFAGLYDRVVKLLPVWRRWIETPLPDIVGPRVLELSFGTGYLLTRYAHRYETWGIDYNKSLAKIAQANLAAGRHIPPAQDRKLAARLSVADVYALPFPDRCFNTILCTMAFTGYPDGEAAMSEISRVLMAEGRFLLIDVNYPNGGGRLGTWAARAWLAFGDIIRDMAPIFEAHGFDFVDREIGGFGSVHYYIAQKRPGH